MVRLVVSVVSAIGEIVYYVMYVPVYVAWHLVGKPISRIVGEVKGQDQINVDLEDIAKFGDMNTIRELLVRAYYNRVMEEATCARSA